MKNPRRTIARVTASEGATPELINILRTETDRLITQCWPYYSRHGLRFDTRYALWDGQNDAGVKADDDAFPWPGASDARVRLADEIIREREVIRGAAVAGKRVQARGLVPNTKGMGPVATQIMKALLYVEAGAMLRDETELGWSFMDTYGSAVMGCYWHQETRLVPTIFDAPKFQRMIEQNGDPQQQQSLASVLAAFTEPMLEPMALAALGPMFPKHTKAELRTFLRNVRESGTGELRAPQTVINVPRWCAHRPFIDCFFDPTLHDLSRAPLLVTRELLSEAELLEKQEQEGWNAGFVDLAIQKRGRNSLSGSFDPLHWATRTTTGRAQAAWLEDYGDRYEILRAFYFVHERGSSAFYQTVFHRDVKEAGLHVLMDYAHGQSPFHLWRMERNERAGAESRGVPEIVLTWQNERKDLHDALRDRVSMEVVPPLTVPKGKAGSILLGAGQQIEQGRAGEIEFLVPGQLSQAPMTLDASLERQICRYFFRQHPDVDPTLMMAGRQKLATDALLDLIPPVRQTWALAGQYLDDEEAERLAGPSGAAALHAPLVWDWTFDVRMMDPDFVESTVDMIGKIIPLDRQGTLNITELIVFLVESIHPDLVARLIRPAGDAAMGEVDDELSRLVQAALGIEGPMRETGNPELRLKALMEALKSPRLQEIIKGDNTGVSQALVENRIQMHNFSLTQQQNAFTGKVGAKPILGGDGTGLPGPQTVDLKQLQLGGPAPAGR